jgi:hypothetical protein
MHVVIFCSLLATSRHAIGFKMMNGHDNPYDPARAYIWKILRFTLAIALPSLLDRSSSLLAYVHDTHVRVRDLQPRPLKSFYKVGVVHA